MQMRVFGCLAASAEEEGDGADDGDGWSPKIKEPGRPGESHSRTFAAQAAICSGLAGQGPTLLRSSKELRLGCGRRGLAGLVSRAGLVLSGDNGDDEGAEGVTDGDVRIGAVAVAETGGRNGAVMQP